MSFSRWMLVAMCGAVLAACRLSGPEHAFSPDITEADFMSVVNTLAADDFEGRAPGSLGESKTVEYLRAQYQRIGLQPGAADGSYFQTVPMVETTADESTVLEINSNNQPLELAFGLDFVLGTRSGMAEVNIKDSPLVFVGYGVNAPEQDWNDYAGLDVRGKTVVILVNDPGFHRQDDSLFEGPRMTYYGRWTYKFEEAARQGAAAALIIHDDAGASYGWDVVENSWSGAQFDLKPEDDPEPRLPAQGWITQEVAQQVFADSGLELEAQITAANQRGFTPVALNATVSFDLNSRIVEKASRNVIGVLPGTDLADQAVVYMAHWDHLGKHEGQGDTIYNGAVDNATGVAGIIEIAEKFAHAAPAPRRSLVFIAVTLEESGLLGSKYYVANPTFPMHKIAGVINLDAMSVGGKSRDVVVTGLGNSELEQILADAAEQQGRHLVEERNPAGGYYFRSDHFNFVKAGVPALYAKGGIDLIDGGIEAGQRAADDYAARYHQPSDEVHSGWKVDGVVEDLNALYGVGRVLVDNERWPNWYEGNPFKATRDASRNTGE